MAQVGYLPKRKEKDFFETLSKNRLVYVPCLEGDTVIFRPLSPERTLCLERPANIPPKTIIFPQSETLFSFNYKKDADNPQKMSTELETNQEYPDVIIFGARPCDAKGFRIFDRVFMDIDTPDTYYKGRREKTVIVTISCESPSAGCFCTAVGGGPADKEGSDAIITELEKGYFIEPVTEKGKAILKEPFIEDGSPYQKEAVERQETAYNMLKNPFSNDGSLKISPSIFNSDEFWEQVVSKCISCGACTYLCPTCYCFNITDEQAVNKGERIRSWDACMFFHYTLEASGHNPRPTKFQRFKNRVGHKFVYYPEKYNGVIACCGCGRCIRYCPVSVDISEIVNYLQGSGIEPLKGPSKDDKNAG
jgi:ferredoxin